MKTYASIEEALLDPDLGAGDPRVDPRAAIEARLANDPELLAYFRRMRPAPDRRVAARFDAAAQRQSCKACGAVDGLDFDVADDVWRRAVPPEYQTRVLCLACFDAFASAEGVDYRAALSHGYFAGDGATLCWTFHAAGETT